MTEKVVRYAIERHFGDKSRKARTIARGLTLEQAAKWCDSTEAGSATCTSKSKKAYTRRVGFWFDCMRAEG